MGVNRLTCPPEVPSTINEADDENAVKRFAYECMVRTIGPSGQSGALRPATDFAMYEINWQWLYEAGVAA